MATKNKQEEDTCDIVIVPLIKTVITFTKSIVRGMSIMAVYLYEIRNFAIDVIPFVKRANDSSLGSLLSIKDNDIELAKTKEALSGL